MITFAVSDVERGTLLPACDRDQAVRKLLAGPVEALSPSDRRLVSCTDVHPLVQAAHDAFYGHLPLVLTPDAVWLCLAQGFARHVNLRAEELRDRFVRHAGREKLTIEHRGIVLGQPSPWPEAFALFSEALAGRLGKVRDLVVADFSTTGPVERAASEIVLMDAFQGYFEYEMLAGCGIPEISLRGTVEDWRSIRRRAQAFSEYGLAAWTDVLLPVLDRVVATAEGKPDVEFWRSFFRHRSSSGPSQLTGWLVTLFPYLDDPHGNLRAAADDEDEDSEDDDGEDDDDDDGEDDDDDDGEDDGDDDGEDDGEDDSDDDTAGIEPYSAESLRARAASRARSRPRPVVWNPYLAGWWRDHEVALAEAPARWPFRIASLGPGLGNFPSGLAAAPVRLVDVRTGAATDVRFVAGLVGVAQDPATLALAPDVAWAVVRAD